ncbi:hypothetical protein [Shewanella aestuarii]|uniref:DUF3352 domain-containing protein n=1 Tax=Shewanella aestuarii TaxID=1028752 RepID=A0A6G9QHZ1_9GAMM|nr:hypothetical protein [Shewanella aestuarii]QIR13677.1 hypothetical protein HBH39_03460 [Shewanella aestuarii]
MKKLAVAAVVLAIGAGAYYVSQQPNSVVSNPVIDNIPADTLMFSGQLTPFPAKDYLTSFASKYQQTGVDDLAMFSEYDLPQEKFLMSLYQQNLKLLTEPEKFLAYYGLADSFQSYFYTLGALPVMKIEIANADAFWAELDRAEQDSGLTHQVQSMVGIDYRAYSLLDDSEEERIDIIFAIDKGWLTITFNTSFNAPELLETALGAKQVDNPITATTMLQDIIHKHGFAKDSVSFINHVELIKGLTSLDGNRLAKQISKLASSQQDDPFAKLRSPECQSELMSIANNWPRTVMGFDTYLIKPTETTLDLRAVVESHNQVILGALTKLRGFIPDFGKDAINHLLSVGVGMDVGQLAPTLNTIWKDLQTPEFSCQLLAESQYELKQLNPAMIGMFTGMANGVKGVNLTVLDYQLAEDNYGSPIVNELDALFSLSADNPTMLIEMVKPFFPPLAQINLPSDGTAVDVTSLLMLPTEFRVQAKMALKGQHLVVYSGDKAEQLADKLAEQTLTANGLVNVGVDYQKMLTPLITAIEQNGEPLPEELLMMKDYNMRIQLSVDVTDKGIEIGSMMQSKAL